MNIYVGNLPYNINNEQLRDAFEEYGQVQSAEVIIDRRSKRSRGYGFVEMAIESDAFDAIDALHRTDFYGRELRVQPANSKDKARNEDRDTKKKYQRGKRSLDGELSGGLLGLIKSFFRTK